MGVLSPLLAPLPGSGAVLAAHAPALPQPDQLCGPFSAHLALHAVLERPPSVLDLALAAGTRVWPHDIAQWRPAGAPFDTSGWAALPTASSTADSGTDAAGLARAIEATCGVRVVPVAGAPVGPLLAALSTAGRPVGVLANVHTGTLSPELGWDVGHFVVVHAVGDGHVGVADTYAELGGADQPPGCRVVAVEALDAALTAAPGRGLLLLVGPDDEPATRTLVEQAGLSTHLWST